MGSDFKSRVRVNVDVSNLDSNQSLYPPILEGTIIFDVISGIAVLKDFQLSGNPGSSYNLIFSTDGIDTSKRSNQEKMLETNTSDLDL